MKVVDLKSGSAQIQELKKSAVDSLASLTKSVVPSSNLDTGSWSEPVMVGDHQYKLVSGLTELYWDSQIGQFTHMYVPASNGSLDFTWEYGATELQHPVKIVTVVTENGVKSTTTVEFTLWQSAAKFPDRFFEF